jgi:anti-sigma factor RsiW
MKVTREVIYDLLPGYFSGEISPDTRTLVDEFLEQDPEFRQMMERFRLMFREPRPAGIAEPAGDKAAFERARSWLQKRSELRGYVVAFGVATVLVLLILIARLAWMPANGTIGIVFIALAFATTSLIAGIHLYMLKSGKPSGL